MIRWKNTLPLALLLGASLSSARAAEIIDKAGMFDAAARSQAKAILDRAEKTYRVPTVIETVATIGDLTIQQATQEEAQENHRAAIYVLIAQKEHKIDVVDFGRLLGSTAPLKAIQSSFMDGLKKRKFDQALVQGSESIASQIASYAKPVAARPVAGRRGGGSFLGPLMSIGLILLVVMVGVRLLGALFGGGARAGGPGGYGAMGRPGYGGGYGGGGGGGFFSGLMGGIGGAMAGNWIYDQMSGRRHGSDYSSGDASYGQQAPDPAPGDFNDAGGGDWGGDAGGGDIGGGGGDWGGGGGGDWGGGGGGGDWS